MRRPPTDADIRQLVNDARTFWAGWRQQAEEDFTYCADGVQFNLVLPDNESILATRPPTAKNKADSAAHHLIANFPTITIDKAAFPPSEKAIADTLEQALQAIFWRSTSGEAADPHMGSALNASEMGMGCIYINVDFSRAPQEPDEDAGEDEQRLYEWRKRDAWPVTLESVDPRELLPDSGRLGERWVAREFKLTVGEVRATYENWVPTKEGGGIYGEFDVVDGIEWWSDDWYYVEIAGQPVQKADALSPENSDRRMRNAQRASHRKEMPHVEGEPCDYCAEMGEDEPFDDTAVAGPWRNPLGFIPYVVFPSGFGTASGKPEHRFQSLITAARKGGLFDAEARRMTQCDVMVDKMAWGAEYGPPIVGGQLSRAPGAYNEVQLDQNGRLPEIKTLGLVNPPTGIFAELARIRDAIDESTVPGVLSSAESGSAESALKFVRKVQEASVGLNPLKSSLQRAWVRVFTRLIRFFDNPLYFGKNESVFIWGKTPTGALQAEIGPKLIKGRHIPVFVEIRPALPEDEALRIQTGLAGLNTAWGPETFYERFARFENPKAATEELLEWQVTQQVIQSGTLAAYIAALQTGQANPIEGLQGFAAKRQALQPPQGRQSAVEPTPDVRSAHPQDQGNAGANDTMGNLERILASRGRAA